MKLIDIDKQLVKKYYDMDKTVLYLSLIKIILVLKHIQKKASQLEILKKVLFLNICQKIKL